MDREITAVDSDNFGCILKLLVQTLHELIVLNFPETLQHAFFHLIIFYSIAEIQDMNFA
jgi:hypothetical protein